MTAAEMKYEFEIKNELIADLSNPDLEDDEISLFLNNAQDKLVEELFAASRMEVLTELIKTLDVGTGVGATYTEISNAKQYAFATSNELMFYIDSTVKTTRTNPTVTDEWIKCDKIDKSIAHKFSETGFNIPWFKEPKMFLEDNLIVVIHDAYTTEIDELKFEYIKHPVRINVESGSDVHCELRDFLHMDVVNKAIQMLMASYEDNERRQQTQGRR